MLTAASLVQIRYVCIIGCRVVVVENRGCQTRSFQIFVHYLDYFTLRTYFRIHSRIFKFLQISRLNTLRTLIILDVTL